LNFETAISSGLLECAAGSPERRIGQATVWKFSSWPPGGANIDFNLDDIGVDSKDCGALVLKSMLAGVSWLAKHSSKSATNCRILQPE